MKIFTTIGVYKNGDFKRNGVTVDNIVSHIAYNLNFRPGRAFIVDGVVLNKGYLNDEEIEAALEKFKDVKVETDTAPYV